MITIRPAIDGDITWLNGELRKFDKFAGFGISLIPDNFYDLLDVLNTLINNHVFLIAEHQQVNTTFRVGFIVGVNAPHHFNKNITVLSELLWWVTEEYRNTRAGALLLKAFMDYGQANADWVVMTLESGSPVKHETLLKRGFKLQEYSFIHEVQR